MRLGDVKCFEVIVLGLHLGPGLDSEPEPFEDALDLPLHRRYRVDTAHRLANTRQSRIEGFSGGGLGRGIGGVEFLPAALHNRFDPGLGVVDGPANPASLLGRILLDRCDERFERSLRTQHAGFEPPQILEVARVACSGRDPPFDLRYPFAQLVKIHRLGPSQDNPSLVPPSRDSLDGNASQVEHCQTQAGTRFPSRPHVWRDSHPAFHGLQQFAGKDSPA